MSAAHVRVHHIKTTFGHELGDSPEFQWPAIKIRFNVGNPWVKVRLKPGIRTAHDGDLMPEFLQLLGSKLAIGQRSIDAATGDYLQDFQRWIPDTGSAKESINSPKLRQRLF